MAQCKGNILSHVSSWELSFTAMINLPEDLPQCNHWTMRLMLWGSVGFSFRGRLFWGDLVRKYFSYLSSRFFRDLVRKELRSIAIGWAALHCHCFDSPPRAFPIVRSSTQIWPGFKAALGGAENINDGFGWTSWCYHHGRQRLWIRERPKPDGNSEEGPLCSLHHLAAKKKRRLTNGRVWKT